jgi:hypothetical protein
MISKVREFGLKKDFLLAVTGNGYFTAFMYKLLNHRNAASGMAQPPIQWG